MKVKDQGVMTPTKPVIKQKKQTRQANGKKQIGNCIDGSYLKGACFSDDKNKGGDIC